MPCLFSPYKDFLSFQYLFTGIGGQPFGGLHTYTLSSGRYDWQKARLIPPCFGILLFQLLKIIEAIVTCVPELGQNTLVCSSCADQGFSMQQF